MKPTKIICDCEPNHTRDCYRFDAGAELALARKVVEASRQIRAFYPGGKLVWFDQFSAFETALAAYDAIREGKP